VRFLALADARKRGHGMRHRQASVLACAAAAALLGAGGYAAFEDVCGKFTQRQLKALGCWQDGRGRFQAPSDATSYRVLSRLDAEHFDRIVAVWLREQKPSKLARLAVDGKTLRGSERTDGKPLQLLSAVTHRLRLTLGSVTIAQTSNESPALAPLLRGWALGDSLITADAMHCQQESARLVTRELGGDYLFGLEGQPERHRRTGRVQALPALFFPLRKMPPLEKAHGRLERHRIKRLAVTPEEIGLAGCWQILAIQRDRIELTRIRTQPKKGEEKDREPELGYYVSSLGHGETSDQALIDAVRGHWGTIENGTHHIRDASLGEDRSLIAQPSAARVIATLRNLANGIYNLDQTRAGAKATSLPAWQRKLTTSKAIGFIR
jgi:predicted transposase YbfD/YdcC